MTHSIHEHTCFPFQRLNENFAFGENAPGGWLSIHDFPLIIMVGLTGTGKSTSIHALLNTGKKLTLLPDRRTLTNQIIIPMMHQGKNKKKSLDRSERFACTRRFRKRYPGGMSYILSKLYAQSGKTDGYFLFDGIRGENEIDYAAQFLPSARFVVLHTPDEIRVRRLLTRNDSFDKIVCKTALNNNIFSSKYMKISGLNDILNDIQKNTLLKWAKEHNVSSEALHEKLSIVISESLNYNSKKMMTAFNKEPTKNRAYFFDTSSTSSRKIVETIVNQLF